MTRKKVKLAWIENASAKKASLKKRSRGLLKKVSELSTLCGVESCVVIFSPEDVDPACWPSHADSEQTLHRFLGTPDMERRKKMTTHETFNSERIAKMKEQQKKQQNINKEREMNLLMYELSQGRKSLKELNLSEQNGLSWLMDEKAKEIKRRMLYYNQIPASFLPSPPPPPLPPETVPVDETGDMGGSSADQGRITSMEQLKWDQWFMEMMNPSYENIGSSSGGNVDARLPVDHGNVGSSSGGNGMGLSQGNVGGSSSSSNVGNEIGHLPDEAYNSWPFNFSP